jgi:DNA polymerase III subunit epsilon
VTTIHELAILDFETTGLLPAYDRTIEVAATLLVDHRPVETFTELMYPGRRLPSFITSLTGITDRMLRGKPRPEEVMPRLLAFLGKRPIVAHNASFDRGFLLAEVARAGLGMDNEFLCTMRLARRLEPGLESYRLASLVQALELEAQGAREFHRSAADVNHAVALWQRLHATFVRHTGLVSPPVSALSKLMRTPVKQTERYLAKLAAGSQHPLRSGRYVLDWSSSTRAGETKLAPPDTEDID